LLPNPSSYELCLTMSFHPHAAASLIALSTAAAAAPSLPAPSNTPAGNDPRRVSLESTSSSGPHYWEDPDWVPRTSSGKQTTPNQIRSRLQRFMDKSGESQAATSHRLGVSPSSFYKFMNPKTYKNQWSATGNGTYWAAARLLEEESNKPKAPTKKRKDAPGDSPTDYKKVAKFAFEEHVLEISSLPFFWDGSVYDSCPELVKKTKAFIEKYGATKTCLCRALGIQTVQLNKFLAAKQQDAAGTIAYPTMYLFFEKLRVLQGEAKSTARRLHEMESPTGFSLETPRPQWVVVAARR
jgi:hypothetical protein